ncbi:MAG TPA: MBL fold metallo-hydrolase [Candidatus Methylomirabilis sp.]
MKITVWGCRGSITSPGPTTLRYGGNSTCLEIRTATGQVLIIDAGSGVRNLGKVLSQEREISQLRFLFTHSHWDHLLGFPFFQPAYSDRFSITFCGGAHAEDSIRRYLAHQMEAPYFPVDFTHLRATFNFHCDRPHLESGNCCMGGLAFCPIALNHPNGGYGFKFIERGKTFIFLTDNELRFQHEGGLSRKQYVEFCRGADLLFHDAQYTDEEYTLTRGWGHSTFGDATDLAIEAGVKRLGLVHHDPDRTDDELDRQVEVCRERIRSAGATVECLAAAEGMVIDL